VINAGPAAKIYESPAALHRLAAAGLTAAVAQDLIETVTDPDASRDTLIERAAPSYRTTPLRRRLPIMDSDRLLRVGRLFAILEAVFESAAIARMLLQKRLSALDDRSTLECSDSISGLERATTVFVPTQIIEFLDESDDTKISGRARDHASE